MRPLLFSFLLLFSGLSTAAQEKELEIMAPFIIEGEWTGKLTQYSGGIAKEYVYEIKLVVKDSILRGNGTIKSGGSFANFELKGILKASTVNLEDVRITNEMISGRSAWCIKKMPLKLKFYNGTYMLEGPWSGTSTLKPCSPGMIYLWKATPRA
jgi:hypothetical protein